MRLEKRGNRYYIYKKRKTPDGKVISEYLGTGFGAQTAFLCHEALERVRQYEQEDGETLREAVECADALLDQAAEVAHAFTSALLVGLGFYRHKYQWRRRRGVASWRDSEVPFPLLSYPDDHRTAPHDTPTLLMSAAPARPLYPGTSPDDAPDETEGPTGGDPSIGNYLDCDLGTSSFDTIAQINFDERTVEYIELTLERAKALIQLIDNAPPNQESADAMRMFLAQHPRIWRDAGFLSHAAALMLSKAMQPEFEGDQKAILTLLDEIRVGLGRNASPPHEQVLIDQVALALLSYRSTALVHAAFAFGPEKSPKHGAYWEDRLRQTERRLQQAVTALARVRKLTRSTKTVQGDLAAYLEGITQANENEARNDEGDSSTTGVATFEKRWQWGPREKVLTAAEKVERAWKNPEHPWTRLRACHKYISQEKMREALDEYVEYLEEIFDEPSIFDFPDIPEDHGAEGASSEYDAEREGAAASRESEAAPAGSGEAKVE